MFCERYESVSMRRSQDYQKRLLASSRLSVRPSIRLPRQLGSHWTEFMKFYIRVFFENLCIALNFEVISTNTMDILDFKLSPCSLSCMFSSG
jgi:hypothetical protein